jgi:hypothetical protein
MASVELQKVAINAKTQVNAIVDALRRAQDTLEYYSVRSLGSELIEMQAGAVVTQNGATTVSKEELLDLLTLLNTLIYRARAAPRGEITQLGTEPLSDADARAYSQKLSL